MRWRRHLLELYSRADTIGFGMGYLRLTPKDRSEGLLLGVRPAGLTRFCPCTQNEVEQIAQKSPKQLTELLERISGSEDLKKDYERLLEEKMRATEEQTSIYRRTSTVNNERKMLKEQIKEAQEYEDLQKKLLDLQVNR